MILLVEGADQQGKTVFCQRIAEKFNMSYVHNSADRQLGKFRLTVKYLVIAMFLDNTVVDRMHMSELIYGKSYRGKSRISRFMSFILDKIISWRGICVLCDRKNFIVEDRKEMFSKKDILGIKDMFADEYRKSKCYYRLCIDPTDEHQFEIAKSIIDHSYGGNR